MTKPDFKLELLKIVATFHTLTTPILIGFFSLLNKSGNNALLSSNPNIFAAGALSIGLLFYFATFVVLFLSYNQQDNKLDFSKIKMGFWMSFVTILIFVVLIIAQAIIETLK